jgi:catechol 2,3-dioxygenase-like lactoylglutathione lyase family enzyme
MINGVHHVSLSTTDMDRLLHFYRDLLGLPQRLDIQFEPGNAAFEAIVGMKQTRGRAAGLRAGNVWIEVFQYTHPVPQPGQVRPACDAGIRHLCFDVTDIKAEYERLRAAGVEFLSEPQMLSGAQACSVYALDPDGNIVELQEIFPGSKLGRDHVRRPE